MTVDSAPVTTASRRIRLVGAERDIACAPDQNVLDASIRAGAGWLPVGCRGGGCGVCRVIVISGEYVAGRMSKEHVKRDGDTRYALACKTYPVSDLTVEPAPPGNRAMRAGST